MNINEEHLLLIYQLEELDSYLSQDSNSLTPDEVLYFLEQRKSLLESLNCMASFYQAVAIQEELITVSQQEASDALFAASFAETAVEVSAVRSRSNSLSSTCSSISNLAIEVSDIPPPIIPLSRSSSGQGVKMLAATKSTVSSSDRAVLQLSKAMKTISISTREVHECVACFKKTNQGNLLSTTCNHFYCTECFRELLKVALKDKSLIPVKCCKVAIDQSSVEPYLSREVYRKFNSFLIQNTCTNKMQYNYCHEYIDLDKILHKDPAGGFHCPNSSCSLKLCSVCHTSHAAMTCAEYQRSQRMLKSEIADSQFLDVIAREGYSQCNSCSMYVELQSGCYHMTCNCTNQFCYLCKKRWKTCHCPQWDEERLTMRARENLGLNANPVAIQAERRNIRNAEECTNHSWRRIDRAHLNCGNCGFYMYVYKYQCTYCRFDVCNTCRYHRLG